MSDMVEYEGIFIRYVPETGQYTIYDGTPVGTIGFVSLVEGPGYVVDVQRYGLEWTEVMSIANLLADLNETLGDEPAGMSLITVLGTSND